MPKAVNPIETLAVVRLLEFLSDRAPWYRSLWGIGVVLAMEELYEACTALRQGHLSEASIRRMASLCRNELVNTLRSPMPRGSFFVNRFIKCREQTVRRTSEYVELLEDS